ncbi:MAG: hypothetical protein PHI94_05895 [Eubacteriaceae bacterium]|nr:hypothetical protein [Eubacteriaceae bacterium]MDD4507813.1 hypothetical protein [Eubacteriaceae bacterium]
MKTPEPILKFKKIQDGPDEFIEMQLTEFQWPKGGSGICPVCGAKMIGIGKDWTCEKCGLKLNGPIF